MTYFSFAFTIFTFIAAIYLLCHPDLKLRGRSGPDFPAPLIGFIFIILTAILFYIYAKVIYLVKIDADTIYIYGVFKKRKLSITEIKSINLFSKENFYWSAGSYTIGTRIELENGERVIIADPFYHNIGSIKQVLSESFIEKLVVNPSKKTNFPRNSTRETDFEKFSGNPHTSVNGLFLYAMILFFILLFFNKKDLQPAHLFLILPFLIFFFGFSYHLNYFLISNKRLVVKNHILPWVNRVYDLEEIAEVNFEHAPKLSDGLRITTRNFKSNVYRSGSLRSKHWAALKDKLVNLQIHFVE